MLKKNLLLASVRHYCGIFSKNSVNTNRNSLFCKVVEAASHPGPDCGRIAYSTPLGGRRLSMRLWSFTMRAFMNDILTEKKAVLLNNDNDLRTDILRY